MKSILLACLLFPASILLAQTDDPPIIAADLGDGFMQGANGEDAVPNAGTKGGLFSIRSGDGRIEIVESDFQKKKALKFSPTAELSTDTSRLPCLRYADMPEDFPRGVTFQARIKPDSEWLLAECDILSARTSDRGPGLAVVYRPTSRLVDVVSGAGGEGGNFWGIISNKLTEISPMDWTHVAAVYDPEKKQFRLYRDGQLVTESEEGLALTAMDKILTIGAYRGGYAYPFRGEMTDVAVFDYVRSPEQISADAKGN